MATVVAPDVGLNKVVVAFLDGHRLRGRVYDFSPLKDVFRLVAENDLPQQKGVEVGLKDLKALFFVKDFRGDSRYKESKNIGDDKPGRKVEVTFFDGEKIVGTTQGYNPKQKGFFVYPADAKSNSLRERTRREIPLKREPLFSEVTKTYRRFSGRTSMLHFAA